MGAEYNVCIRPNSSDFIFLVHLELNDCTILGNFLLEDREWYVSMYLWELILVTENYAACQILKNVGGRYLKS